MPYTQYEIDLANKTNLVDFLLSQGEEVIKSGREYRWKEHDSVCIDNNKWFQHSQNKGGYPVEFLMNFYGISFTEAMERLTNQKGVYMTNQKAESIPSENEMIYDIPDVIEEKEFILPPASENNDTMRDYLINKRGIDEMTVNTFETCKYIYEDADYHNVVFVGYDKSGKDAVPKYASKRSTTEKFRTDVSGSDKSYGFWLTQSGSNQLMVFEAPIDMISFLSLYYRDKSWPNCVSLGGVSPKAMERLLKENNHITEIYLCLDNDEAGNNACERIAKDIKKKYSVTRVKPSKKDWNDVLIEHNLNPDFDIKAEKISLSKHEKVPVIKFTDIEQENIVWLWDSYIAKRKITLIQGDGGVGKTTATIQIVGALTSGRKLPGMNNPIEPINVIIQSAEDGYGDTIKPRLENARADMNRVMVIDEKDYPLSLDDERIYRAIKENNISLAIFDPLQAYLGEADMNRAHEMRQIFKVLAKVADETGCAIILIGHLNKNSSANAQQRAMGSTDIGAAVRCILTVTKIHDDNERRLICNTKNNIAPIAKSIEFVLDKETGFRFIGLSDMKYEDAVSLRGRTDDDGEITESLQEQIENAILDILSSENPISSNKLNDKLENLGFKKRTMGTVRADMKKRGIINIYMKENCWYVSLNN